MISKPQPVGGRTGVFGTGWRRVWRVALLALLVFTIAGAWLAAPDAEGNLATEQADTAELVRNMLTIQSRFAADQHRRLARGTHAKGVCARAQFEVFDLTAAVPDRDVGSRLAKGIYARPAVYPAVVRFANGESHIYPDSAPDVRAMSFSLDLTGAAGPAGGQARQDYSMNDRTTFPLNDAHEFAVATRVVVASGMARGVWSLPFRDKFGFARTAILGRTQQHPATEAYQRIRYWSTVPYRHGPADVIKYSVLPCATNTAMPLGEGPNPLHDELVRHVNDDQPTACFDFALQFLDADRMTRWGRRRTVAYWTENASVEWDEAQAPFHNVGRLTLLPKSALAADVCEAQHIDVTEYSSADSKPLGSINRARWSAESSSRKARLGR